MPLNKTIQREIEVAFSKHTQPVWFRILKYILLGCLIWFLWESEWLWIVLATLFVLAMLMHFWYRHKTNKWTKSYGGWKYHETKTKLNNQ